MTNEWGAPIPGDEMKAIKGRIDPKTWVLPQGRSAPLPYSFLPFSGGPYQLPANHPYYKVREHNAKHGTNLVLHDGSAKVPKDWDGGMALRRNLKPCPTPRVGDWWASDQEWGIIAYTPKPKESEVTEQFPSDEAIEYVLRKCEYEVIRAKHVKEDPIDYRGEILAARLIQQYEPDRLKSAVDVAAEEAVKAYSGQLFGDPNMFSHMKDAYRKGFKAGAAWQKENGNG